MCTQLGKLIDASALIGCVIPFVGTAREGLHSDSAVAAEEILGTAGIGQRLGGCGESEIILKQGSLAAVAIQIGRAHV